MSGREVLWKIDDKEVACRIDDGAFYVSGNTLPFRILDATHIEIAGKHHRFYVLHTGDTATVWLDGHTYLLKRAKSTSGAPTQTPTGSGEIRALMPGKLLHLEVALGDIVTEEQTVATIESMKMECALTAPIAGRVSEIRFQAGEVVEMGEIVMVISV